MSEQKYVYVENDDGVLFRGASEYRPTEFWDPKTDTWHPWGGQDPVRQHWADEITEDQAKKRMAALKAHYAAEAAK
jgi:hypothetical protein